MRPQAPPPSALSDARLARVVRGGAANLVGAAVSTVAAFALVVVIARGMSPTDAGVFFSTTSVFLVASTVGQLGTDLGLVYFLSRSRALARLPYIGDYLRAALWPVFAVSAVLSLAILAGAPWIAHVTNPSQASDATTYLRVLAPFIVPTCIGGTLLAATRGFGTMRPYVFVEQMARPLVQVLLVWAVVYRSPGIVGLAWALPYVAWLVAAYVWFVRIRARYRSDDPAERDPVFAAFWGFTAPRSISSIAQLLLQRVDIIIVGALAGPVEAASFTTATRFAIAGQVAAYAVSLALQPVLAGALARNDLSLGRRLFQTVAGWSICLTWPLYLTFCVYGETLLGVFGRSYPNGADILTLVTLGMLVGTACGDVDTVLVMSGMTKRSLANTLLGLAVMIGLDFWLVPAHGAIGAAIGWGAAIAVKNIAGLAQVWVSLRLQPFGPVEFAAMALTTVCFVGIGEAVRHLALAPVPQLALALIVASAAYLGGLWLLRGPLRLAELRGVRRPRATAPGR